MQWHQLDHMHTICTLLQTDNHNNTSSLNNYRPDVLPNAKPTVSNHWRTMNIRNFTTACSIRIFLFFLSNKWTSNQPWYRWKRLRVVRWQALSMLTAGHSSHQTRVQWLKRHSRCCGGTSGNSWLCAETNMHPHGPSSVSEPVDSDVWSRSDYCLPPASRP